MNKRKNKIVMVAILMVATLFTNVSVYAKENNDTKKSKETGTRMLYHTPTYYFNTTRALSAYASGATIRDSVTDIKISGPESKLVQTIYPCNPEFPLHCEF